MKKCCSYLALWPLLITVLAPISPNAAERLVPSEYPSIQAAVDAAASGDTIHLAAGDYYEQAVVLNKTLSIIGDPSAVLHAHNAMNTVPWNQNVAIFAFERANVTVSGLIFEGHRQGDSYPDRFMGIIFRSSSGRLENCTIRGFRSTFDSRVRAVNINNALDHGIIELSVTGCSFSDNKLSLAFFGSDNNPSATTTRFVAQSNTFVGLGVEAPFRHFGLLAFHGAEGLIQGNTFTDHIYNEIDNQAGGIIANDGGYPTRGFFLPLRPLTFSGNVFSNNSIHASLFMANTAKITNNVFAATTPSAAEAALFLSGTNILIADNNFADTPGAIWLFGSDELDGLVSKGPATNLKLTGNWFRNVTTLTRQGLGCTFTQEATQTSAFRPRFLSHQKQSDGRIQTYIRAWHQQSLTIQTSPNLQDWTFLKTIPIATPLTQLETSHFASAPHLFLRTSDASEAQSHD